MYNVVQCVVRGSAETDANTSVSLCTTLYNVWSGAALRRMLTLAYLSVYNVVQCVVRGSTEMDGYTNVSLCVQCSTMCGQGQH